MHRAREMRSSQWFAKQKASRIQKEFESEIEDASQLARNCAELNVTSFWYSPEKKWIAFTGPYITSGISVRGSKARIFRLLVRNTTTFTLAIEIVAPAIPNVELRYQPTTLSPGMQKAVTVLVHSNVVCERYGAITIRATNCAALVECLIYVNVVHPATGANRQALPAPRSMRLSKHAMEHCRATPDEFSQSTIDTGVSLLRSQGLDRLERSSRPQSALSHITHGSIMTELDNKSRVTYSRAMLVTSRTSRTLPTRPQSAMSTRTLAEGMRPTTAVASEAKQRLLTTHRNNLMVLPRCKDIPTLDDFAEGRAKSVCNWR